MQWLCMLGKHFSRRHFEIVFLISQENKLWHFMQTVFLANCLLHEISKLIFWEKYHQFVVCWISPEGVKGWHSAEYVFTLMITIQWHSCTKLAKLFNKMKYRSTRGDVGDLTFEDALFTGYAADGGILVPEKIPTVSKETLTAWSQLGFVDLAKEIISLFIRETEIPRQELNGNN